MPSVARGIVKNSKIYEPLLPPGNCRPRVPSKEIRHLVQTFGQLQLTYNKRSVIYIVKQDIRICIYIYMLPIAGQTAGPIGLIFLWTLMGVKGLKNRKYFF